MEININSQKAFVRDVSLASDLVNCGNLVELKGESKIQLHPSDEGETIAVISNAVPIDTDVIKGLVCTEHNAASTIEYAMAIIEIDSDEKARSAVASSEYALCHSGWHQVEMGKMDGFSICIF